MINIPLVDLKAQYIEIKEEIDNKIQEIILKSQFINGDEVELFERNLANYGSVDHAISCGNGTDALQLALMSLGLKPGDEVITPAFSYIAAAEVIALLGLKPIFTDVRLDSFEMILTGLEDRLSPRTKAIIPVYLFGQANDLKPILEFAEKHSLFVIEDNAQSIGSTYSKEEIKGIAGSFGHLSTFSFFPSKNLACYGDGGAILTSKEDLAQRLKMLSSHGQSKKYVHDMIGVNSRLDTIQAGILNVKLKYLNNYIKRRQEAALEYDKVLSSINDLIIPARTDYSTHVFHQYTVRITNGRRDELQEYLKKHGIATAIYYPIPIYKQKAYSHFVPEDYKLNNTEQLCKEVLSLPIHSHIPNSHIDYVCQHIIEFFNN